MLFDERKIIQRCVEAGAMYGVQKSFKYYDVLHDGMIEQIVEQVYNAVMLEIDELLKVQND